MKRSHALGSQLFLPLIAPSIAVLALFGPLGCADEHLSPAPLPGPPSPPPEQPPLVVHYYRPLADYTGWGLTPSGDTTAQAGTPLQAAGTDEFGSYFSVPLKPEPASVSFTIQSSAAAEPDGELSVTIAKEGREVWVYSESARVYTAAPAIPEDGTAIVYYRRADEDYTGWGLHVWNDTTDSPTWEMPIAQAGTDPFGAYFVVHLKPDPQTVGFTLHKGDLKDPGPDMAITPAESGRRLWVLSGDPHVYTYPIESSPIDAVRAHWVTRDTIAWDLPEDGATLAQSTFALRTSSTGEIKGAGKEIVGGKEVPLTLDTAGLSAEVIQSFPYLAAYKAFKLGAADLAGVGELLKGQLVVTRKNPKTGITVGTGLQIPGVLDDLYASDEPLGVLFSASVPSLKLWAPTARSVALQLFDDASPATRPEVVPMSESGGVWSVTGTADWTDKFYLYDVEVYVPSTGAVQHNLVTDPYSVSLAANSTRSQIVDLNAPALKPVGWDGLAKPPLEALEDTSLYEMHVRDFSVGDASVPAPYRGTFMAFTETASAGMGHLAGLAAAGLTHVHLLPINDITSVPEVRADQKSPGDLGGFAPDAEDQQAAVAAIKAEDGFNWGYDPYHYAVPEGSYATDPNGPARIFEVRSMVAALNGIGLRVVMDVVFNHTAAGGQASRSVLDRVVPGYYHRLDAKGAVETSTCCQNTATEHAMMGKLMVDSLVRWATAYKIDGFRFDLMGHHLKSNLVTARSALTALTPERGGVDGSKIVLYGEGWDYGEVANNARGVNATQRNMAGTQIGTFNDRLRDAVRGGGPFDSGDALKQQGFINGLFVDPNGFDQGTPEEQKAKLLKAEDQIRIGLAGNLKDYTFEDALGNTVTGAEVDYNGAPAGYTLSPSEAITYVSAHDNQTLFDVLQYKIPEATSMEDRVRIQNLGISIVALGQGTPFFDAGIEMLRSKSLDRDSYDSGDWFNKLDFSYASNNWGVGLPIEAVNKDNWPLMKPLLADPGRRPAKADILRTVAHFQEVLRIRRSSRLLRLATGADVAARVRFHNTGPAQVPGLIVMSISDEVTGLPDLDPATEAVVLVFNAAPGEVVFTDPAFSASVLGLHPVQQASTDAVVRTAAFAAGTFTIPARTTAVFVGTASFD